MRKWRHLVAIYQSFPDRLWFNSIHRGMKNLSRSHLRCPWLPETFLAHCVFPYFPKPRHRPVGTSYSSLACQHRSASSRVKLSNTAPGNVCLVLRVFLDSSFQQNNALHHGFRPFTNWRVLSKFRHFLRRSRLCFSFSHADVTFAFTPRLGRFGCLWNNSGRCWERARGWAPALFPHLSCSELGPPRCVPGQTRPRLRTLTLQVGNKIREQVIVS